MSTSATNYQPSLFHYRIVFVALITWALANLSSFANEVRSFAISWNTGSEGAFIAGSVISGSIWFMWLVALGSDPKSLIANAIYLRMAATNSAFSPAGVTPAAATGPQQIPSSIELSSRQNPNELKSVTTVIGDHSSDPTAAVSLELKAVSLYAYTANPEDPNELSFNKGDAFIVMDNKGKWWHVRHEDGRSGIAPSNYMQLVD